MHRRLTLALIALLAIASSVQACECVPPPPAKVALEKAAAVFVGKVMKIERDKSSMLHVTLEVQMTWKGTRDKLTTVLTKSDEEACGFGFEVGKTYLVYCYQSDEEGRKFLRTNICTRTRLFDAEGKKEIEELGRAKMPPA
jgi:hypothetical protein